MEKKVRQLLQKKGAAKLAAPQTDDKVLAKSAGILFIKSTNSFIMPAC
jgi:hypothetical protein